jgi:hypothetical protein
VNRRARVALVFLVGLVVGVVVHFAAPDSSADALCWLGAGIVLGELLVFRLEDGSALPLSYAVFIVLASSFSLAEVTTTVLAAELVAFVIGLTDRGIGWRVSTLVERLIVASATYVAYRLVWHAVDQRETVAAVLGTLAAAALAQVAVDLLVRKVLRLGTTLSARARLAWLAIASSGILMAIGYRGVDGEGKVGIWGPVLFSTPLLAAWYAFERLDSATRSYKQTIEALSMAPELGGMVAPGHAERVAVLAAAMGQWVGLSTQELNDLEIAALLHHVGQVTLDEPSASQGEVAAVTSAMLRDIRPLSGAGEIVGGDPEDPRRRLAVQVLRVASDYDDLTVRDHVSGSLAIETLRSAPGYVYEAKVLAALERALTTIGADGSA